MPPKEHLSRPDSQAAWIEAYIEQLLQDIPSSWPKKTFPFKQDQESMQKFVELIRSHMYRFEKEKEEWAVPSSPEIEALLAEIDEAFGDVSDEGASDLALAGEALDGPYFPEMIDILSRHEIRGDWRKIPHCLLFACSCCLSFVQPLGYRFLLPAFLCFSLKSYVAPDMVAHLAASEELLSFQLEGCSLLNQKQLDVVTRFMNWHRKHDEVSLELGWLLPWEMEAYLAQDEHRSPQDWILAHHEDLWQ